MKKHSCIIVAAALQDSCAIERKAGDYIIAADAGYLCCVKRGIVPDLVVGDFDSMHIEELEGAACEHVKLPCAKDDTDTLAALRASLEAGYQNFEIYGGFSTDMAHSFANLQCLDFLEEQGAHGFLHTQGQVAQLVTPQHALRVQSAAGKRLSVFAWGSAAKGVEISGTRWELHEETLTSSFPIGVSNVITNDKACVCVKAGKLLCVLG